MKKIFILLLNSLPFIMGAQNVGIGTTTPAEKLDVNGNINVTGTIKANGVDGTANQVLMKNSSGNLAWGDIFEYKNFKTFFITGNFTVPTGVTKIFVELWGAGGSGNNFGGGGGGAYACGLFDVTPATVIAINVGAPGAGGATTGNAANGGDSHVTVSGIEYRATGGFGALSTGMPGSGGIPLTNSADGRLRGLYGLAGLPTVENYMESAAGTFLRSFKYGDGGNTGNSLNTGAKGGYRLINAATSAQILYNQSGGSSVPGGGGAAGLTGQAGSWGMAIVYY
jgi:hypothetical protein